jgi:hypothetical protein
MVICVAAMPRSGTSLVTQLLHRCGMNIGPPEQLLPPSVNNTDGFWENRRFVSLNERLLNANHGSWYAPPANLQATPAITAEAKAILAQFDGLEPWLWKDPRNALTLPFWQHLVPSMKVLVCVRQPAETAASLAASTLFPRRWPVYWDVTRRDSQVHLRDGSPPLTTRLWGVARTALSLRQRRVLVAEVAMELWRIYNRRMVESTSAADRIVVHYDMVLSRPRVELERILTSAGITFSSRMLDAAVSVVSQRLRHQHVETPIDDPEIAALYGGLCSEAGYDPSSSSR